MTQTSTGFEYNLLATEGDEFNSTAIEVVAYNRETQELFIDFIHGDAQYIYHGVSESTYNLLVNSVSVGRFYQTHIQGAYSVTKGEFYPVPRGLDNDDQGVAEFDAWADTQTYVDATDPRVANDQPVGVNADWADFMDYTIGKPVTSKYGVKYMVALINDPLPRGPFEPTYDATDEGDALRQFREAVKSVEDFTGNDYNATVKAVTHYFD